MKLCVLASLAFHGVLALDVSHSGVRSLRAGSNPDLSAEVALKRVEAIEDTRSSRLLCRIAGPDGSVTVRLQPSNNARSLVFNDDVEGVETKVRCLGQPDAQCLAAPRQTVQRAEDCPLCPCSENAGELYGSYANFVARDIDARCGLPRSGDDTESRFRILLLGLGGGQLANHLVKSCDANSASGSQIDAVELDGRLPALGRLYFGLADSVKTTVGDAGPVVASLAEQVASNELLADQRKYDSIFVDCFSTGGVTPEHCRSEEFVGQLHSILRVGGKVMHHMWHTDPNHPQVPGDFSDTLALYKKIFACKGCSVQVQAMEGGPDSIITVTTPSK